MADTKAVQKVSELKRIEQRWGKALADAGWTAFPSTILAYQKRLGLSALDLNIVLQIAQHWWDPEKHAFPSKARIAAAIGVKPRSVQRRIAAMEAAGLIERVYRRKASGVNQTNVYKLNGLARKAEKYAHEVLAERAAKKKADAERNKPRLQRVK